VVKLSKVIGTVVLSTGIPSYGGQVLHVTQDLDEDLEPVGDPEVSATWQAMQEGNLVVVEVARESANAFEPPIAIDSVILAKVDSVHIEKDPA
jgi:microcompartment protein CcmK/EutM